LPGGEPALVALLGESTAGLARRVGVEPSWWLALREILAADADHAIRVEKPVVAKSAWLRGFSSVVAPFVRYAGKELTARLRSAPVGKTVALDAVLDSFAADLAGDLVSLACRVLVLELNVARVEGRLSGATGAERFWSFVAEAVRKRDEFFTEYPVLARQLVVRTQTAVEATWELCERWYGDRLRLARGGAVDGGRIESIQLGLGDRHGGRSVGMVTLTGGVRWVYKPRPLAAHVQFNALVAWLNRAVPGLDLRTLTVQDRGDYGWVEFIEPTDCADTAGLDRYYRRLGVLAALLNALDATDVHFENLIAAEDQPVLVDMETLFHQGIRATGPLADDPAQRALDASVHRLGLLSMPVSTAAGSVDFAGLGGDPVAVSPYPSATWEDDGTDTMRVVRRHMEFTGGQNRPTIAGEAADPLRHADALTHGFRVGYQALVTHRAEVRDLLERFADTPVRIVARATQTYATLLTEGNHPDLLRDALDQDRHFSLLWVQTVVQPRLAALVREETADLWAGDIPIFMTRPGTRDLWTSRGHRLEDQFDHSGLDRARAKLGSMGGADQSRQEWVIRAALTMARTTPTAPVAVTPTPGAYLAGARQIAERLVELAIRDGEGRAGWLGAGLVDETTWRMGVLGWDFYGGSTGVALFLDAAGRLLGEPAYRDLAEAALWRLPSTVEDIERGQGSAVNGLVGLPGLAYALTHLGRDELADRVALGCDRLVEVDENLDSNVPLELARRAGARLMDRAEVAGRGVGWTGRGSSKPLTGFSHGASGIGWALTRLGTVLGDDRMVETGIAAFRYERDQFRPSPAGGNWADYRGLPGGDGGELYAWCHGAAGIGLARADVSALVDDDAIRADLDVALRTTLLNGFGHNHSQCHGDLGNVELLLAAGHESAQIGRRVLDALAARGPQCGTPNEIETPSLMLGLAGIGYGLLRLAEPVRMPALLLVQPPIPQPRRSRV
jgi:lantibiotic modifying enzyme